MNDIVLLALMIPITVIVGGLVLAGLAIHRRTRLKELMYRERIAMIEKGLVPPPEVDPARFERFVRDIPDAGAAVRRGTGRASRQRSLGVMLIGLAMGLATIIGFAGNDLGTAVGVGGLIGFLGLAMLVNGLLSGQQEVAPSAASTTATMGSSDVDRPSPGL